MDRIGEVEVEGSSGQKSGSVEGKEYRWKSNSVGVCGGDCGEKESMEEKEWQRLYEVERGDGKCKAVKVDKGQE